MSSPILSLPESLAWKQAYMAAILEKNRGEINHRIDDAREKLSTRLREITVGEGGPFYKHKHEEEIEAIHEADYLLEALRSSLAYRAQDATSIEDNSEGA
jgi:hypothetical protein